MNTLQPILFTKDKTLIVKGVAILFMILHHCLIPDFYVTVPHYINSFPALRLQIGMKMCVGVYTFILGYGFFYCKSYNGKYVLSHVYRLLKDYWIILFGIMVPLSFISFGGGIFSVERLWLNAFGINPYYCLGNWYVYFYVYALCILPLIKWSLHKQKFAALLFWIFVPGISATLVNESMVTHKMVWSCLTYTPMLAVGMFCASSNFFIERLKTFLCKKACWCMALFIIAFRCAFHSFGGITTDVIVVPCFIVIVAFFANYYKGSLILKMLSALGENATNMWFLHCVFFSTATRGIIQNSVLWNNNVLIVFIGVTLISYYASRMLKLIVNH